MSLLHFSPKPAAADLLHWGSWALSSTLLLYHVVCQPIACHVTKVFLSTSFPQWPDDRSNGGCFISLCLIVYWFQSGRNDYIISLVSPSHSVQPGMATDSQYRKLHKIAFLAVILAEPISNYSHCNDSDDLRFFFLKKLAFLRARCFVFECTVHATCSCSVAVAKHWKCPCTDCRCCQP